ncbi:spore coat associated protein CotJA [Anaerostipes sp. MSJ-23]|nr:spore coat associated protein CotJA [Anaerostipes sp. MSJ-23]
MQVAMQYVPWQQWNQIYCPEEGLSCGTIFPELNKPFYGKGACRR